MVAYNFQKRFAPDVASGRKRQTIRAKRTLKHAQPGEHVQLYTGMRRAGCRLLAVGVCEFSTPVRIESMGAWLDGARVYSLDSFAQADGFETFTEMKAWFAENHGLPFDGILIKWRPTQLSEPGDPACSSSSTFLTVRPSLLTPTR